jgi:autonomous glycyl radical cofactor GrcA
MELFNEQKIGELEAKVDSIISAYKTTKEENGKLLNRVHLLESENSELKEKMVGVKDEREKLIEKVRKILEKIEKVEV